MAKKAAAARAEQKCDACAQVDDHPRHSHWTGAEWRDLHLDCCASEGCQSCASQLKDAGDKRGLALAEHLSPKE